MWEVIIFKYFWVILPIIWKETHSRKYRPLHTCTSDELEEEERHDVNVPTTAIGYDLTHSQEPLVHYIARMYTDDQGHVSILSTLWVSTLVLAYVDLSCMPQFALTYTTRRCSFIFASVHQTTAVAVWVVFELSKRKKYIPAIREELSVVADSIDNNGIQRLSYEALRRSTTLDSFIREVFRTKGDTLSVIRATTHDIPLGEHIIPKGLQFFVMV